jgi:hypothetical protein
LGYEVLSRSATLLRISRIDDCILQLNEGILARGIKAGRLHERGDESLGAILARSLSFNGERGFGLLGKQIMDGAGKNGWIATFDNGARLLGKSLFYIGRQRGCSAHQRRIATGAEEIVVDPLAAHQPARPSEVDFGIEKINVARRDYIGYIEPPPHQKLIQVPGSTRENTGRLGPNPLFQLARIDGLEDGAVCVQSDGFIAQGKAEIAEQPFWRVIPWILLQYRAVCCNGFSGSGDNFRTCRGLGNLKLKLFNQSQKANGHRK